MISEQPFSGRYYIFETVISEHDEFESGAIISRFAHMVAKDESIHCLLKAIHEYGSGIPNEEVSQIITDLGYPPSLIHQVIYYGFISQAKNAKLCNTISYHLTEKGLEVLEACEEV